jgi:hypothetical protein
MYLGGKMETGYVRTGRHFNPDFTLMARLVVIVGDPLAHVGRGVPHYSTLIRVVVWIATEQLHA